jgi:transcription initiation factor TFIID subunit 1
LGFVVSKNFSVVMLTFQQRERQKLSEGGVDVFLMREVQDLSARDGALVMLEYCEEHPPLLSQPGMASKIRNYFKRVNTFA